MSTELQELDALDREWARLAWDAPVGHPSRYAVDCYGSDGPWEWLKKHGRVILVLVARDDAHGPESHCSWTDGLLEADGDGEGDPEAITRCAIDARRKLEVPGDE